jgi:hypothetical protein
MRKYEVSDNLGKFAVAGNLPPRKTQQTPARESGGKQPIKCPLLGGFRTCRNIKRTDFIHFLMVDISNYRVRYSK